MILVILGPCLVAWAAFVLIAEAMVPEWRDTMRHLLITASLVVAVGGDAGAAIGIAGALTCPAFVHSFLRPTA